MKEFRYTFGHAKAQPVGAWIAGALLILLPALPADAARIHQSAVSKAEVRDDALWTTYLDGGAHEWATVAHPTVTPVLEASVWRSLAEGTAYENPMVEFLLYRQSVDPARFDFYHPRLAIAFAKLIPPTVSTTTVTAPTTPTTSTSVSPPGVSTVEPEAQVIPPVPEPTTLWLALGMLTWGAWHAKKVRSK